MKHNSLSFQNLIAGFEQCQSEGCFPASNITHQHKIGQIWMQWLLIHVRVAWHTLYPSDDSSVERMALSASSTDPMLPVRTSAPEKRSRKPIFTDANLVATSPAMMAVSPGVSVRMPMASACSTPTL